MGHANVTRQQWLDAGLARFGSAGLPGLNVEAMAQSLGSSKAGFYWYFKSRARYEKELVEHWREAETKRLIAAAETEAAPADKILRIFDDVVRLRRSADFLFHLRRLARKRRPLARLLEQTERERLGYVTGVLVDLGKRRDDATETAEALYHLYLGWYERNQFKRSTPREIARQLRVVSVLVGANLAAMKGAST